MNIYRKQATKYFTKQLINVALPEKVSSFFLSIKPL